MLAAENLGSSMTDSKLGALIQGSIKNEQLKRDVLQFISQNPSSESIITRLIQDLGHGTKRQASDEDLGNAKKTKLNHSNEELTKDTVQVTLKEVSFALPLRKRLDFKVGEKYLQLVSSSGTEVSHALNQLDSLVCVPTPDKPQNWTLAMFVKGQEPIMFSFDESKTQVAQNGLTSKPSDSKAIVLECLKRQTGLDVIQPNANSFSSSRLLTSMSEYASKPKQPRSWISCNIGVKEAWMYLLPQGVFIGFKKPISFYKFSDMISMQTLKATSRTIDLEIKMKIAGKESVENITMIDINEFDGISTFIRKHKSDWGKPLGVPKSPTSAMKLDDSDEEDEDYAETSSDSEEEGEEGSEEEVSGEEGSAEEGSGEEESGDSEQSGEDPSDSDDSSDSDSDDSDSDSDDALDSGDEAVVKEQVTLPKTRRSATPASRMTDDEIDELA